MLVPSPGWLSATAMGFGYGLRYREAEAAAKLLEPVQPVETLEYVWKFRFRYAWTSVPEVDAQLSVGAADLRVTRCPSGPYFTTLSTRASIACSTRTGSTLTRPVARSVVSSVASCFAASAPARRS